LRVKHVDIDPSTLSFSLSLLSFNRNFTNPFIRDLLSNHSFTAMVRASSGVTVQILRKLLLSIGSATSGKKELLLHRLPQDVQRSRLPILPGDGNGKTRILSIDMGIKNLAFCVIDIPRSLSEKQPSTRKSKTKPKIPVQVQAWRRLNVVDEVAASTLSTDLVPSEEAEEAEDPYTPSALSKIAFSILSKTLLPYKPDIILIERQRWRSASSPSIQQWTIRVNTLEGMFWAILEARRAMSRPLQTDVPEATLGHEVFGVDPKRVGQFWLQYGDSETDEERGVGKDGIGAGPEGEIEEVVGSKKISRTKAEKKAKIQLLRSWLSTPISTGHSTASPDMNFTFSEEADKTKQALCAPEKKRAGKRTVKTETTDSTKVDDVTDCFLQATAWVAWEQNRLRLQGEWEQEFAGRMETSKKTRATAGGVAGTENKGEEKKKIKRRVKKTCQKD
jgi:cruciform cutting endonuclease 1